MLHSSLRCPLSPVLLGPRTPPLSPAPRQQRSSRAAKSKPLLICAASSASDSKNIAVEAAQKDEKLGFAKRAEESKAAGVVSWRPPAGGDPPPPPGQPWAWSLNWDPVYYEDSKLKIIVGACPKGAEHVDRLVDEAGAEAILCLQSDDCFSAMGIDIEAVQKRAAERGVFWARVAVRDFDRLDQATMLPEMVRVLSLLVHSGRRTYVHCTAGINRANLSVLGFLTWVKEMDYDAAHALIKEARPQANPYKVSWEIAGGRLVAGKEEDLYLALTKKGASELDGGDWIARDIAGARTAVIMEMFRRRTEVDMQLVVSAGGLGRKPSKARRALTAEGAKPRNTVTDEDYDSYDDDSSEDGSDDEEEDEGMKSPPPPKARNSPLPKEAGAGKGGKGGKSGKDKGKGKKD